MISPNSSYYVNVLRKLFNYVFHQWIYWYVRISNEIGEDLFVLSEGDQSKMFVHQRLWILTSIRKCAHESRFSVKNWFPPNLDTCAVKRFRRHWIYFWFKTINLRKYPIKEAENLLPIKWTRRKQQEDTSKMEFKRIYSFPKVASWKLAKNCLIFCCWYCWFCWFHGFDCLWSQSRLNRI